MFKRFHLLENGEPRTVNCLTLRGARPICDGSHTELIFNHSPSGEPEKDGSMNIREPFEAVDRMLQELSLEVHHVEAVARSAAA